MLFNTERAAHVMALPCHRRSMELLARLSRHGDGESVRTENLGVGTWIKDVLRQQLLASWTDIEKITSSGDQAPYAYCRAAA
jgi:hypothetical protein